MVPSVSPMPASGAPPEAPASVAASASRGASSQERLLALIVCTQTTQLRAAESSVNLSFEEISRLREEVREALEKAREAQEDSGFWSDIGKLFSGDLASLAQVVAAAAAIAATGGTAVAVLSAIALATSLATKYGEELGIPPEVALSIGLAAGVASVCCGDLSGVTSVSAAVKATAGDIKLYANLVGAGATIGGGVASGVSEQYHADAVDHRADARWADARNGVESMDIDESIERFSAAVDRQNSAIGAVATINQREYSGAHSILNNMAGAA